MYPGTDFYIKMIDYSVESRSLMLRMHIIPFNVLKNLR
jgi:hypothetical protein